jgi:tRNA dimethylallyltransferase
MTWFRRDPEMHWLAGVGNDPAVLDEAVRVTEQFLRAEG